MLWSAPSLCVCGEGDKSDETSTDARLTSSSLPVCWGWHPCNKLPSHPKSHVMNLSFISSTFFLSSLCIVTSLERSRGGPPVLLHHLFIAKTAGIGWEGTAAPAHSRDCFSFSWSNTDSRRAARGPGSEMSDRSSHFEAGACMNAYFQSLGECAQRIAVIQTCDNLIPSLCWTVMM